MKKLQISPKFKKLVRGGTALVLATSLMASPVLASQASVVNGEYNATAQVISVVDKKVNVLEPVNLTVARGVNIYYDDKAYNTVDVNGNEVFPFIYNGTTYLPARSISGIFGASIKWDGQTKSVYIERGKAEANIPTSERKDTKLYDVAVTGSKGVKVYIDGEELIPGDVNGNPVDIYIIDGTTYLPVRAISQVFNTEIKWEGQNNGVYLGKHIVKEQPLAYPNMSKENNQRIQEILDYFVEIEPYRRVLEDRNYIADNLWGYSNTKLNEIKVWSNETKSTTMNDYYQQLYVIERQLDELRKLAFSSVANRNCIFLKVCIDNLTPESTDSDLTTTSFENLYLIMQHILKNYKNALAETEPDKISAYYSQVDEIYNKANALYNSLNKSKVLKKD